MRRTGLALLLVMGSAGCATRQDFCTPPLAPYLRTTLYIDRSNTSDRLQPYSAEEYERFVGDVLGRHLPAGGTIFETTGWWRRPDGTTFSGIGRALVVLAPSRDAAAHRAAVRRVIAEVKGRYGHRLVIWEEAALCAAF